MNCIIVTQDFLIEKSIRKLVLESDYLHLLSAFQAFDKASAYMADHCIDILFFDIQMYDFGSIEFIYTIPEDTFVIFVPQPDPFINSAINEKPFSNLIMKRFKKGLDEARFFLSLGKKEKYNRSSDYFII
ncbi:hypothetical protein [Chryseobacterium sp.]|uniref:hypothetical protein n=1 Tax=Chryseobacterium sp. TaxID=1871047 RepID=UPI0031DA83DE